VLFQTRSVKIEFANFLMRMIPPPSHF
jgi:hypothetical protein